MEQLNISQLHGLVRTGLYEVGLKLTGHTVSKTFQEWPPGGIATENEEYLEIRHKKAIGLMTSIFSRFTINFNGLYTYAGQINILTQTHGGWHTRD